MFTISHGKINISQRETDFDYIDNASILGMHAYNNN